jgi:predicted TIM-barrel fold metal-dependent hydrolase
VRWRATSTSTPPRWFAATPRASASSRRCAPDVDGALAELAHAFDTLRADGVVLLANSRGVYLGDARFDPLFDELQRRKAVVFVHPSTIPGLEPLPGVPAFVADFLLDTRARRSCSRDRDARPHPHLKIIPPTRAASFLRGLSDERRRRATGTRSTGSRSSSVHFDTALSGSPTALPSLLAFAEPGHVTFGSDWPYAPDLAVGAFMGMYEAYGIETAQRKSIDRSAAETLFPRLQTSRRSP